jgi:hypothetical protein
MSGADGGGNSVAFTNREKKRADISQRERITLRSKCERTSSPRHTSRSHILKTRVNGRHRMLVDSACGEHLHKRWDWTLCACLQEQIGGKMLVLCYGSCSGATNHRETRSYATALGSNIPQLSSPGDIVARWEAGNISMISDAM